MSSQSKIVAVFGSALPKQDHVTYQDSFAVGKSLGEAGHSVMTGGYNGVMAAASEGAASVGARVFGVTCLALERQRGSKHNIWVTDVIACETLRERIYTLTDRADAYVIMPGGLGTLNELVFTCEMMRAGEVPRRPVVCYSEFWRPIISAMTETEFLHHGGWGNLFFAHSPAEVVSLV
jgi:uncharacterized protein (TIGR00730 family)